MTLRLGFITHLIGGGSARDRYEDGLRLFEAADELGFDSGWVAQHHLSDGEGRLASPFPFLAAAAQRTGRIRLGSAVSTITLDLPVRVAEDAAVADVLAGGRLELGVGSGNPHPAQFAAFGRDVERRRPEYGVALERLRSALRGDELAPGRVLAPAGRGLQHRIWETPLSVERVRATAAAGDGLLLGIGPAATVQLDLAREYLDAVGTNVPRIGVVHAAFFGDDRAALVEQIGPPIRANSLEYYAAAGWVDRGVDDATLLQAMNVHVGTPDDVAAQLAAEPVLELATDLVLAVEGPGAADIDVAIAALETIATRIAPGLGWTPARTERGAAA